MHCEIEINRYDRVAGAAADSEGRPRGGKEMFERGLYTRSRFEAGRPRTGFSYGGLRKRTKWN